MSFLLRLSAIWSDESHDERWELLNYVLKALLGAEHFLQSWAWGENCWCLEMNELPDDTIMWLSLVGINTSPFPTALLPARQKCTESEMWSWYIWKQERNKRHGRNSASKWNKITALLTKCSGKPSEDSSKADSIHSGPWKIGTERSWLLGF